MTSSASPRGERRPGPYRVVQWATGSVGREAMRAILLHPALELTGVLVHSAEKSGKDAGELCGAPPTGIVATDDKDAILKCDADCVVYTPRLSDVDDVCALLRSGKNVVCTPFLFYRTPSTAADTRKIEEACREGNSSVYGTGIHPGFVGMSLPLALSAMSKTIEHVRIEERADWTFYDSPRITFDNMRFGHAPEQATLEANPFARFNAGLFEQQVWMLSDAFGAEIEEVRVEQELTVAPEARDVASGRLEEGTVSGQRYHWIGLRDGTSRIEIEALWSLGGFYPDHWPKPRDGWTVSIEGEPSFQTHFMSLASFQRSDATIEEHVQAANVATAMQAVNSIPALCEAEAGWRSVLDLGAVRTGIGFTHRTGR